MIDRTISTLIVLCWALLGMAQEFNTHWICYPEQDSTSQVWFRQSYSSSRLPQTSMLTVVTTGYVEVFVNERNVTNDILTPLRKEETDDPIGIVFDIKRFIHRGKNTIAVWYSPAYPHINDKQLSVVFSGRYADGTAFAHVSDRNWLCKRANRRLTKDGNEEIDGRDCELKWNSDTFAPACWVGAHETKSKKSQSLTTLSSFYDTNKIDNIREQDFFDLDGDSISFDFVTGFKGWLRVTLRDAKRGEHINIGGMEYICNGNMDEQAFGKFAIGYKRRVLICGDKDFKPSQIQRVEAVNTAIGRHESYRY